MSLGRKLKGYLQLMRPHNLVAVVITTSIGWLTVSALHKTHEVLNPIYPVLTVALVAAGGYVINDYFDVEVDKVNKAYRPIPSGVVGRGEALVLSLALGAAGVALSLTSGPYTFVFAAFSAALTYLYSYRIKEWGFAGNLVVAFEGAASIIYGGLASAEYVGSLTYATSSLLPALYAFLLLLGREIVKTIEDYKADELRNVKSLPRVYGVKAAAYVASLLLACVVAISALPYLMGYGIPYLALTAGTDLILMYSIRELMKLPRTEDPEVEAGKLRSVLKVAIFLGSLAFLVDLLVKLLSYKG
ncbi:MAG: geranylgeranylglycerol-phosphate geranylgeranyltransferase [Desulfurococcales archaeon]|nr:geranylgeranylglycerol-phosphate geranylgeranyltransferase [Desulfurococcales archaeon]